MNLNRLKKDKQDLRTMLKKAQVLLDKYRAQLRSHIDGIQIIWFKFSFNFILQKSPEESNNDSMA